MKTRLDILTDIEDELNCRLPIDILPSDTKFNDKWYSEQEIKEAIKKTRKTYDQWLDENDVSLAEAKGYTELELLEKTLLGEK